VFVYWGFEPMTTWQFMLWSRTPDWDGVVTAGRAPAKDPKFKWISIDTGAVRHPGRSADDDARTVKHDIDSAFELGYRVVVSGMWTWDVAEFTGQFGALSAAGHAPAIHGVLHDNYEATPVLSDPFAGNYFELKRKYAH
jgi:hypothetical protein